MDKSTTVRRKKRIIYEKCALGWAKKKIIPSQMEVAPLHCTVDITQKRRLLKNTEEIEKMLEG